VFKEGINMEEVIITQRQKKLEKLISKGLKPYPNDFKPTHKSKEILTKYKDKKDLSGLNEVFSLAGRVIALRHFGKAVFIHLKDETVKIQAYFRKDLLGQEQYENVSLFDVGDIIGISGKLFFTKTAELTILVEGFRLLSKALRPLPEKYHGLKDVELRYRQRYLDLLVNEEVGRRFLKRAKIINFLRAFFIKSGFIEVETPMMQTIPGGALARPFKTFHKALGLTLFLRVAPELYLKRLLIGGFEQVFELNRNFRNEGLDIDHNPEFTMLEFYKAYATYKDLMVLTEELIFKLVMSVLGKAEIIYQGNLIDLTPPWPRLDFRNLLSETKEVPAEVLVDEKKAINFAKALGISLRPAEGKAKALVKIFEKLVEPKLIQPSFVIGYPVEVSPLARRNEDDPQVVDRFELFIGEKEIANGFSELNDPEEQKKRFLAQLALEEDREISKIDEDYITALQYAMPPAAGEGIGIDRLVMILTDAPSIRDVILFPHLRPQA
jgi:lysyl-tRNA synthetase class 2